jgi:ATP-dependent exoDNAse (exonuclease V) alpha subunit
MARHGAQQVAVLAVSHVDCEDLADRIRTQLRANGQIRGPEVAGPAWGPDDRRYAAGDRILLHANTHIGDRRVTNGTTGRITQVTGRGDLDVLFDDGRTVILPTEIVAGTRPDGSPNLSHAWARTIDGAQGGTWDQVRLLATPNVDRHTLYVGQSRGRNPTHTWNVVSAPDDEIHGNVVADDRGPDEITLSARRSTTRHRVRGMGRPQRARPTTPGRARRTRTRPGRRPTRSVPRRRHPHPTSRTTHTRRPNVIRRTRARREADPVH